MIKASKKSANNKSSNLNRLLQRNNASLREELKHLYVDLSQVELEAQTLKGENAVLLKERNNLSAELDDTSSIVSDFLSNTSCELSCRYGSFSIDFEAIGQAHYRPKIQFSSTELEREFKQREETGQSQVDELEEAAIQNQERIQALEETVTMLGDVSPVANAKQIAEDALE